MVGKKKSKRGKYTTDSMARKKSKTTAMVVYNAKQVQTPPRTKKNKKSKKSGDAGPLAAYRAALADPFSITAQGSRVPDMFSCPTVTRHITRSFTLTTDANGEADLVVLPSALQHAISPRGNLLSENSWTTGDGVVHPAGQVITSTSDLSTHLVNYRIVGYGVKIIGLQSDQLASGKMHVATLPVSTWVNSNSNPVGGQVPTRLDPAQSVQATLAGLSLAYGGSAPNQNVKISALPSLPNSVEVPVGRLNEIPLSVIPKITSPEAFGFRLTFDSTVGFASVDQTSASWVTSGDSSYLRIAGHEAVVVALTGCTVNVPVVEVEVVYHLEGAPWVGLSNNVVAQDASKTVVNPMGLNQIIQQVATLPAFRAVIEAGGNMLLPGLGTLANKFY